MNDYKALLQALEDAPEHSLGNADCARCRAQGALTSYQLQMEEMERVAAAARQVEETRLALLAEHERKVLEAATRDDWIYVTDRMEGGSGTAVNLVTKEVVRLRDTVVEGTCGMRRQRLRREPNGRFTERSEFAPLTPQVVELVQVHARRLNNWCIDPICPPLEQVSDDPAWQDQVRTALLAKLTHLPYEVEILGLQLRHLLYYSDGNRQTQKRYLALAPLLEPAQVWTADWTLNAAILNAPTQQEVLDANQPDSPIKLGQKVAAGNPLLWNGPAIMVRLLLDGQQAAFGGCRIYLNPETLDFICSDWCQRAGQDTYSQGIDLQVGAYDLTTWLIGSCVPRAMQQRVFTPKSTTTKVVKLSTLEKPRPVLGFEEALMRRESAVARHLRTMNVEDALTQMREDLHPMDGGLPRAAALHKVPMRLIEAFSADTRVLYAGAVSDCTIECGPESIGLTGYTKSPTVYVRAEYLEIDEDRVRAYAEQAQAVVAPTAAPILGKTQAEVEAAFFAMHGVKVG